MAFDVSGLSTYFDDSGKDIVTAAVAGNTLAKYLIEKGQVISGVKNKKAIKLLSTSVSLNEGSSCGSRNPTSTSTLGDVFVEVKLLNSQENLCADTLRNTIYAAYLKKGQSHSEEMTPEIMSAIADEKIKKVAEANGALLWRGDTTVTGTTNINKFDGVIKQIGGSATSVTGATVIQKLQNFYLACDEVERAQEDFAIHISKGLYEAYLVALANANLFHEGSKDTLFGTPAKFVVHDGMNGASVNAIAGRAQYMVLGRDGESDEEKAEFTWSVETRQYYNDVYYALGVKVITPSKFKTASIS